MCLHSLTHLSLDCRDGLHLSLNHTASRIDNDVATIQIRFKRKIYIPSARRKSLKQHFSSSVGPCPPHPTHFQNNTRKLTHHHRTEHGHELDHPLSRCSFCTDFFRSSSVGCCDLLHSALFRVHLSLRMRVATTTAKTTAMTISAGLVVVGRRSAVGAR